MTRLLQYVAIASTIGLLALVGMLILALSGCTPVTYQDVDNSTIKEGHMRVSDVRACENLTVCWPWIAPHKSIVYRTEEGELKVVPEQANEEGLSALENPVGTAVSHWNWGMP